MAKKLRIIYAITFAVLLLTEIYIALFVRDNFVRPYIGDLLVTLLICCFFKIFIPLKVRLMPLYVFAFSVVVELLQYINIVKLLGLESNAFISTIVGTTFSLMDIVCYGLGCVVFWLMSMAVTKLLTTKNNL